MPHEGIIAREFLSVKGGMTPQIPHEGPREATTAMAGLGVYLDMMYASGLWGPVRRHVGSRRRGSAGLTPR